MSQGADRRNNFVVFVELKSLSYTPKTIKNYMQFSVIIDWKNRIYTYMYINISRIDFQFYIRKNYTIHRKNL